MRRVICRDGDMLDALCKRYLGAEQTITAVLDLNPGLAEAGPVCRAGQVILFPDAAPVPARSEVRLWGRT